MDIKNKAMLDEWLPNENGVEQETVFQWIEGILNNILWARYIYWKEQLNLKQSLKSIELGCGYGKFSMALGLTGIQTTLFDYNALILETASKLHRSIGLLPKTISGDLLEIEPTLKNTFDIACSFGTLEHFSGINRFKAFQAHSNVLKPGGLLFFTVPNRSAIFYRIAFGARKKLGLFSKDFYEEPFSINELKKIALKSNVCPLEIGSVSTLKEDFNYWIMNNVKSAYKKLFHIKKKDISVVARHLCLDELDFSRIAPDNRTYLDKIFSYSLLFVGVKSDTSK